MDRDVDGSFGGGILLEPAEPHPHLLKRERVESRQRRGEAVMHGGDD